MAARALGGNSFHHVAGAVCIGKRRLVGDFLLFSDVLLICPLMAAWRRVVVGFDAAADLTCTNLEDERDGASVHKGSATDDGNRDKWPIALMLGDCRFIGIIPFARAGGLSRGTRSALLLIW